MDDREWLQDREKFLYIERVWKYCSKYFISKIDLTAEYHLLLLKHISSQCAIFLCRCEQIDFACLIVESGHFFKTLSTRELKESFQRFVKTWMTIQPFKDLNMYINWIICSWHGDSQSVESLTPCGEIENCFTEGPLVKSKVHYWSSSSMYLYKDLRVSHKICILM